MSASNNTTTTLRAKGILDKMSYFVSFNFSVFVNEYTKPFLQQALPSVSFDTLSVVSQSDDTFHYAFKNIFNNIEFRVHSKSTCDRNPKYVEILKLCTCGVIDLTCYGFISIEVDAQNCSSLITHGWLPVGELSIALKTPENFI